MIRLVINSELDDVVSLWLETSIHSHGFIDSEYWRSKQSDMRTIYLPSAATWVYEADGRLLGFYSLVGDTLAALFVLPAYHGQGVGSKLLEHAVAGRGRVELTVYKENFRACSFYIDRGFRVVKEQTAQETGQIEYHMVRDSL